MRIVYHTYPLIFAIIGCMSNADGASEYIKLSDLKELISEATAPLVGRIEKLETKVGELEAGDIELKARLRDQDALLDQYRTKVSEMEKLTTSRNKHCLSLARRMKFLEKRTKLGKLAKTSKQMTTSATKESTKEQSSEMRPDQPLHDVNIAVAERTDVNKIAGGTIQRRAVEIPVAFQVKMSKHLQGLAVNQDIVFDTVVTNIGNAYHASHGVFVAPVTGIYVFQLTIMPVSGATTHASINVNGRSATKVDATDSSSFEQGSTSLVIQLNKGDDVAARSIDYSGGTVYGNSYSQFNGFLLTQDVQPVAPIG